MASLKSEVLAAHVRTLRTDLLIEKSLHDRELKELHELFRDGSITTMAIHKVLIGRGISVSYSSLIRYREQVKAK